MTELRALVWEGGNVVVVRPVPVPEPQPGWVAVDIAYAGICGSDLHVAAGEHVRARRFFPLDEAVSAIGSLRRGEGMKVLIEPEPARPM